MLQLATWCIPGLFIRATLGGNFDTFWEAHHDGPFPAGVPRLLRYLAYSDVTEVEVGAAAELSAGCCKDVEETNEHDMKGANVPDVGSVGSRTPVEGTNEPDVGSVGSRTPVEGNNEPDVGSVGSRTP